MPIIANPLISLHILQLDIIFKQCYHIDMKILLAFLIILLSSTIASAHTATWNDNSDNEDGFILQQCDSNCDNPAQWTEVLRTSANVTQATFTATLNSSYRILAFNIFGDSPPSNLYSANPPVTPTIFVIGP